MSMFFQILLKLKEISMNMWKTEVREVILI